MTPFQSYRRLRAMARADRLLGFPEVAEQLDALADKLAVTIGRL